MDSLLQVWRDFWLSRHLRRAIATHAAKLFNSMESKAVLEKLTHVTFPLLETRTAESQRVKLAILILSDGKWGRFQEAIKTAQSDWRDVLIAAGMASANWREAIRSKGVTI